MADNTREKLLMDFGWKFHEGDLPVSHWGKLCKSGSYGNEPGIGLAYDDTSWRSVDLPHDFAIESEFDQKYNIGHGYVPMGTGWYRRQFVIPAEDRGRKIFVEFEGAFRDMTLYVNQFIAGRHESGYGTIRFDITDFLNYGSNNVLAVRVDGSQPEGWWYEGTGIYRHVWMIKTSRVYIPFGGIHVQSWFNADPEECKPFLVDVPGSLCRIRVKTVVSNSNGGPEQVKVRIRLLAPDGSFLTGGEDSRKITGVNEETFSVMTEIEAPRLWALDTPWLYTAVVEVMVGDHTVDRLEEIFGIRTIRFDPGKGFFLNGKPLKIKGAANHYDHAGVGSAVPDMVNEFRIRRLKEFGFNAYRASVKPCSPAFLDACDRLGMLVLEEPRTFAGNEQAYQDIRRLVLRDRNHPSIILWGFANEETNLFNTPQGAMITKTTAALFHSLDPTRPTTTARNCGYDQDHAEAVDVLGYNYHWDQWDINHERFPDKPVIETEMASTYTTRSVYFDETDRGRLVEYDRPNFWIRKTFTREEVTRQMERQWMSGGFIWTGFDYRGEPTPFHEKGWRGSGRTEKVPMVVSCHFGTFDLCGFPKDEAYYYKSWYQEDPVLHVFPHWNWAGKEGMEITVAVYSNMDQVDLLVNGSSAGCQTMQKLGMLEWKVPYQPGHIEAVGYQNGKEVLRQRRETTGCAAAVHLLPENGSQIRANREDVAIIRVTTVDSKGRFVPNANNMIKFHTRGAIRILGAGNGDPADLTPNHSLQRKLFGGLAQIIVQALDRPGEAWLVAEGEGLVTGELKLDLTDSPRRLFLPAAITSDETVKDRPESICREEGPGNGALKQDDYAFYDHNTVTNPNRK